MSSIYDRFRDAARRRPDLSFLCIPKIRRVIISAVVPSSAMGRPCQSSKIWLPNMLMPAMASAIGLRSFWRTGRSIFGTFPR